jgi:predicted nucleic-acid-binding Zn-ribbon protein
MLLFCKKCGKDTEQNYLGMSLNPPRIASRCPKCGDTNFADSWKVHSDNNRLKQEALKAKLAAQAGAVDTAPEVV